MHKIFNQMFNKAYIKILHYYVQNLQLQILFLPSSRTSWL